MKKLVLSLSFALLGSALLIAGGYKVGDKAADFKLENVDGNYVSLADYSDASGFIVVFNSKGCPYSKA